MSIERRILFSPEDLVIRLMCKRPDKEGIPCGAEVFVPPLASTRYGEYECSRCGERWDLRRNSNEAHFVRFLRDVIRGENKDLEIVLEIKDLK